MRIIAPWTTFRSLRHCERQKIGTPRFHSDQFFVSLKFPDLLKLLAGAPMRPGSLRLRLPAKRNSLQARKSDTVSFDATANHYADAVRTLEAESKQSECYSSGVEELEQGLSCSRTAR